MFDGIDIFETASYFTVVSGMASAGLLIVAIVTALLSLLTLKRNRKKMRINKACELALFFSDNIIWKTSFVTDVYSMHNMRCIAKRNALTFTWDEALDIVSDEKLFEGEDNIEVCATSLNIELDTFLWWIKTDKRLDNVFIVPPEGDGRQASEAALRFQTNSLITQLLNQLEWFSMNFNYEIAAEKVVYQSLHQVFLSTVQILYFFIALHNKSAPSDKYYTNLMILYNKWKARDDKKKRIFIQAADRENRKKHNLEERSNRIITNAKNKINRRLKKAGDRSTTKDTKF